MNRNVETISVDGEVIEFSVIGQGEPILIMHGGHSSCYEEFGYATLVKNGFSIITPSRAGYGRTSKSIGESLSKACQHYAKVLDYLQFKKVHVIAVSAGGPAV